MDVKKDYEVNLDEILANPTEITPATYQYYKNLKNRTIIINEEISGDIIELAVLPLREMANDGSNKPIKIILSSYGGGVYEGFTLVDEIDRCKCPLEIEIMGVGASMGGLIPMAGYGKPNVKRVCSKFTVGLLHDGNSTVGGTSSKVRDTVKFAERYEKRIKDFMISHSKIDENIYNEIERQEFWMDSSDMLKYGIVDEII